MEVVMEEVKEGHKCAVAVVVMQRLETHNAQWGGTQTSRMAHHC